MCVGVGDGQCVNMTVWKFYSLEVPTCPKCSVNLQVNPGTKTMQFGAAMTLDCPAWESYFRSGSVLF